ncbi:hypothetical protein TIFTF001_043940 [Ficus carica]|uniref:Uncharacterized protein n=1 Tax=Ficus carica TaxID=3494 RepID=A0AA87YXK2_FICCA|nr:hypothetical protein TIFTF001_043940 [Ficus carica]
MNRWEPDKREMGVWDFISGTADSVKRNAPNPLTSVKSWGSISYEYTKAGVNGVYNAVKVNAGDVLSQHWPSEETRSKILPFAVNVAKYSSQEALKYYIPGDHAVELKALHAKIDKLGKKVGHYEKLLEQMEMKNRQCLDFKPSKTPDSNPNSVASQKPEDCEKEESMVLGSSTVREPLRPTLIPAAVTPSSKVWVSIAFIEVSKRKKNIEENERKTET